MTRAPALSRRVEGATLRARGSGRRTGKRPGALYEFLGWDPRALLRGKLKTIVLYDGQTRQQPEVRRDQHLYGSPNGEPPKVWGPLVTDWRVVKQWRRIGNWWLDIREAWLIAKRHPVANIQLNRSNRHRIPPWEMKRLMEQIERAGGVAVLVRRANGGIRAGWSINRTSGDVTWYGADADTHMARWTS